ncbi:hypothetical protein [Metamycoplasma buccale]|uniref:hypothetical protein n=1 Tax=Metamycoplasma buccale TaxID=55602 RepID=UPI00398E561E
MYNEKRSFRQYWKDSWNLYSILYFFISIAIYLMILFLTKYIGKKTWVDSLTVTVSFIFTINMFILIFKWGFAKGIINKVKDFFNERSIRMKAKRNFLPNMSQSEKDRLIAKERNEKMREDIKKEKLSSNKNRTNLIYYIFLIISLSIVLFAIVPLVVIK